MDCKLFEYSIKELSSILCTIIIYSTHKQIRASKKWSSSHWNSYNGSMKVEDAIVASWISLKVYFSLSTYSDFSGIPDSRTAQLSNC